MTHDELYAEIGKRIRDARERHGLTQEDLATAISLTRTSITNIERGRQRFLLHTLYDIAVALHEEPYVLLPGLDVLQPPTPAKGNPEDLKREVVEPLSEQEWGWIRSTITPEDK